MSVSKLVAAARRGRGRAIAPYSGFQVGAALLGRSGRLYLGANVENASYGLTVCAERVALLKALTEGERSFTMIAVVADTEAPTPPCGPCRQLLWEYCGDIPVVLANLKAVTAAHSMRSLLPWPFEGRLLAGKGKGQRAEGKGKSEGRGRSKRRTRPKGT